MERIEGSVRQYSDYGALVAYMETQGWKRRHKKLNESNTELVTTHDVAAAATGRVCDVTVPSGFRRLSIMGTSNVPAGADRASAYPITLRCADTNDTEIAETTNAQVQTIDPYTDQYTNVDTEYHTLSLTANRAAGAVYPTKLKVDSEKFRMDDGVMVESGQILRFNIIAPNIAIDADNVKMTMVVDLWTWTG